MSVRSFLVICVVLALCSLSFADSSKPSLVVNLFRHGHRGPITEQYSSGWDKSEYGILTSVGMRMHYILGAALVKSYPHLLNKPYDPSRIYVRSTAVFRAYQSVTAQLYGVYGGNKKLAQMAENLQSLSMPAYDQRIINEVLGDIKNKPSTPTNFKFANIAVVPEEEDIVLRTPETCPVLMAVDAINFIKPHALKFNHRFSDPAQDAATKVGAKVRNTIELAKLVDSMYSNHYGGHAQPGQLKWDSQTARDLIHVRDWYFVDAQYTSSKQREILPAPLFDEIFRHLDAKAAGKSSTEFVFLSAHDVTLMTILATLDIVTGDCVTANYQAQKEGKPLPHPTCVIPPFAANIIFEFYEEDNGSKSIAVKYNSLPVHLCNNKPRCEYNEFRKLIKKVTNGSNTQDYIETCKNDLKNKVTEKASKIKNFFKGQKTPTKEERLRELEANLVKQREDVFAKLFAK